MTGGQRLHLVGTHGSAGYWKTSLVFLIRINHSQSTGKLSFGISDDGIGKLTTQFIVTLWIKLHVNTNEINIVLLLTSMSLIQAL